MLRSSITIILTIVVLSIFSCKKQLQFQTTQDGIKYAFVQKNDTTKQPVPDDIVVLNMKIYGNDSLLFSTKEIDENYRMKIIKQNIPANFYEAIMMMHEGDSMVFYIDAFNFYQNTAEMEMPSHIKKGDKLKFYVRLKHILTKKEIEQEAERLRRMAKRKEKMLLDDYLTDNNINVKPTESGLYFIPLKKGNGKKPKKGDSVFVLYELKLTNGNLIETSFPKNKPFGFVYGDTNFIKGWREAVSYMRLGDSVEVIIPSNLAYGEKGIKHIIPPFSTLIFKIKMIDVKKNK